MVDAATGGFAVAQAPGLGVRLNRDGCAEYPRISGRLPLFGAGCEHRAEQAAQHGAPRLFAPVRYTALK